MNNLTKNFLYFIAWVGGSLSLISAFLIGLGFVIIKSKKYMMGFPDFMGDSEEYIYIGSVFVFSILVSIFSFLFQARQLVIVIGIILLYSFRSKLIPKPLKELISRIKHRPIFIYSSIVFLTVSIVVLLFVNISILKVLEVKDLLFQTVVYSEFELRADPTSLLANEFGTTISIFTCALVIFLLTINYIALHKTIIQEQKLKLIRAFNVAIIFIHFVIVPIKYGFANVSFNYPRVSSIILDPHTDINSSMNKMVYLGENNSQLFLFTLIADSKKRRFVILNKSQIRRMELNKEINVFKTIRQSN